VIALHILIRAGAGPAAIVTAAPGEVPGATETASAAGPRDVIARARLGASRARASGGVMRTAGRRPVARR
jgi:hypothetical protein